MQYDKSVNWPKNKLTQNVIWLVAKLAQNVLSSEFVDSLHGPLLE